MKTTSKFIIFIFMFFSFSKMHCAECEKYANQIMNSFIKDMEKKYKINCCGSGGRMPHDVEEFNIGFVAYNSVSIEEARKLEFNLVEDLLNRINSHKNIRPFLSEYPFTKNRINIFIVFEKRNGSYIVENSVAFVTHVRDKIKYKRIDSSTNKYVDLYEELDIEAEKLLKDKKADP